MRRFKQYLGAEMKEKSAADINMATTYGKFTAKGDIDSVFQTGDFR
jgi:hypothetical protein